jgi:transposase
LKQQETSTKPAARVAGVDVGKHHLDAAVHGQEALTRVRNEAEGCTELIAWLKTHEVVRVGLEATGGYERRVRSALEAAGFEVVVHQPLEVRLFARLKRRRAKNDRVDARTIAAATTQVDAVRAAQDPRLQELAERLTAYEHVSDHLAQLKTFLGQLELDELKRAFQQQIAELNRLKATLAGEILRRIKAHTDLKARFDLLISLPGFGPIVAAALIVRMPELGSMAKGQAACLLGVAPFDRDSGQFKGQRFIAGGRARPRRFVYLAALSAQRNVAFRDLAQRILAKGKPKKLALVAVMRKLIEAANLVLKRGQPWLERPAS